MKRPFTLFYIEEDIFIALPLGDDGKYDSRLVYLVGKRAVNQVRLFDII